MDKNTEGWIIFILILLTIGGAGWYFGYYRKRTTEAPPLDPNTKTNTTTGSNTPASTNHGQMPSKNAPWIGIGKPAFNS